MLLNLINHLRYTLIATGHKAVGNGYWYVGMVGGLIGFALSILIRWTLVSNGLGIQRGMSSTVLYNSWITSHGLMMLFVFVTPQAVCWYGTYILPLLLGSSELVLPRLNGVSLYMLVLGVSLYIYSQYGIHSTPMLLDSVLYTPLSASNAVSLYNDVDLLIISVHLMGISSACSVINLIVTFLVTRPSVESLSGSNLYRWSVVIVSLLLLGALPVLVVSATGILLDHSSCIGLIDSHIDDDLILLQPLYWFIYRDTLSIGIFLLFALISMTVGAIAHTEVYSKLGMIHCIGAISFIGYVVWAHHMISVGMDVDTRAYFSVATALVCIPTSVKVFSWIATLSGSSVCLAIASLTLGDVLLSATFDTALETVFNSLLLLDTTTLLLYVALLWCILLLSTAIWLLCTLLGTTLLLGLMYYAGIDSASCRILELITTWTLYVYTGTAWMFSVLLGNLLLLRGLTYSILACSTVLR